MTALYVGRAGRPRHVDNALDPFEGSALEPKCSLLSACLRRRAARPRVRTIVRHGVERSRDQHHRRGNRCRVTLCHRRLTLSLGRSADAIPVDEALHFSTVDHRRRRLQDELVASELVKPLRVGTGAGRVGVADAVVKDITLVGVNRERSEIARIRPERGVGFLGRRPCRPRMAAGQVAPGAPPCARSACR